MRLSAYVPDGLWARVRDRFPGARPSPTAQLALRRLVDRPPPRLTALPAPGHRSPPRQDAYDEGYEAGLARCEALGWTDLERLAAADWPIDGLAPPGDEMRSLAHRSGMRDALRDVGLGVVRAVDGRA